jgi:hypothetical protein
MSRRSVILLVAATAMLLACGGQSQESRAESAAAGPPTNDVPPATLREHDWPAAAKGHGAAGPFTREDLDRLEKASAPGASVDAGAPDAR